MKKNHRWTAESKILATCVYCGAERKYVWNEQFNCKTAWYRTPRGTIAYYTAHITKPAANWTSSSAWRPGCIGIDGATERGVKVPPNPIKIANAIGRAEREGEYKKKLSVFHLQEDAKALQRRIDQIDPDELITHSRSRPPELRGKSKTPLLRLARRRGTEPERDWGRGTETVSRDVDFECDGLGAEC